MMLKTYTLSQIEAAGLWSKGKPLRLHLGCGEKYFDGYINIDYPESEHTVQTKLTADLFADITTLSFPEQSVDEIRLHHVFEHFDRVIALAMLCKWHAWLKIGGNLCIETPDFKASLRLRQSLRYSYKKKQGVLRHIFGSHEAQWAVHRDGWYRDKFQHVLSRLGFADLHFEFNKWRMTRNIIVKAKKQKNFDFAILKQATRELLRESMIDESETEEKLWQVWCQKFNEAFK